ncbi:predicted Hydrolase of HD superfamily [Hahella chejuensis KCTC 2396]|uniref:Predicted Hydrolase of HD superfamily n=1 Tax=Hahella chejuensis (strain KCTC 2396) TaxID=349521 RepID=Q2SG05_HAHCH|nr:5'-deoxynucleotidase [Hahella chejuensis]ABC30419.1 predicted Hydrolase of HD superfamily [Hahella chejuensis KCTC 2396]
MTSKFFAYLERLRWIKRWGLKRNVVEENVMEHSWQVATIAHVLGLISNRKFNGDVDPNVLAVAALYHDVSEIITGDMPSPIKYHSEAIKHAYHAIEREAEKEVLSTLPDELQNPFEPLLLHDKFDAAAVKFVKAADLISAYLKCQMEVAAGNKEFDDAKADVEARIRALQMPEVEYFMATFVDSYLLTLDELLKHHDPVRG